MHTPRLMEKSGMPRCIKKCDKVDVLCYESDACRACNAAQPVCRLCAFPNMLFDSTFLLAVVGVNRNEAEVAHCHNALALRYDYANNWSLAVAHLKCAAKGGHIVAKDSLMLVNDATEPRSPFEFQGPLARRHSI